MTNTFIVFYSIGNAFLPCLQSFGETPEILIYQGFRRFCFTVHSIVFIQYLLEIEGNRQMI